MKMADGNPVSLFLALFVWARRCSSSSRHCSFLGLFGLDSCHWFVFGCVCFVVGGRRLAQKMLVRFLSRIIV